MSNRPGILFVASGPSGTGKTTLCRMVEKRLGIAHSVSCTTRPPRMNEVEGRDYRFVDDDVFERMVKEGAFLEWARVHGHRYGTPKEPVEKMKAAGQDLILDLDTQGALAVKARDPAAVLIFIDAPDLRVLEERLGKRGTEDYDKMKKRLEYAERERKEKEKYDYVLINEDLEKTYTELVLVIQKERVKRV